MKTGSLSPKRLAYSRLCQAVKTGRVKKPENCQECSQNPGVNRLGRTKIEGHHHHGYGTWKQDLDVIWLCHKCHSYITPTARGERNGAAKLTDEKVREIRKLIDAGLSGRTIGKKFNVTKRIIFLIRDKLYWSHVK